MRSKEQHILRSPRILVIDDHPIVRAGISALLAGTTNSPIEEAATGAEAVDTVNSKTIDIAIADLELPDMNGMSLINLLHNCRNTPRIVVYTMHEEPWTIGELQKANVDAVVLKGDDPYELNIAVESVKIGLSYMSARFQTMSAKNGRRLTERETEVLALMCDGMSSRQIAERLFVSENTVEYHRKQIMRRIGAKNNVQAVSIALHEGLLPI